MRIKVTLPAIMLLSVLAACGGGYGPENDPVRVCQEQAEMAKAGRTDGRPITITCPTGAGRAEVRNSYNANADMYRAGNAAMIAVGTAK
ncbi:hypothetical protein HOY34_02580 [Xinfangfangia sp. D13-10-4-6]|uniref:hypothetical protein n=1 Tax=Pseudogemmobacter hezensis TaxID=2737662 RepID=UPI001556F342|nr:hypothetical protein [Pseudogemmobacter hezensis]NPD14083.1 hypothetical protein [Pseudogemmobacter hezensis]